VDNLELVKKYEGLAEELVKWREKADEELKAIGDSSKESKENIAKLEKELLDHKVVVEKLQAPVSDVKALPHDIGAQFVESKQYKDMLAVGNYESARFTPEVKEVVSSQDASAGYLVEPHRVPGILTEPEQPLRIRNLLSPGKISVDAIEYVEESLFTNSAAETAESYEAHLSDKPESTLRFTKQTGSVKTIAHWIPASRQIIADAPALRSYINERLTYGLKLVEDQDLADDVVDAADAYDTTLEATVGVEAATRIDHLRLAILQARQSYYPVSGIVLNPVDWAAIELLKDTQERYLWVSVTDGGVAKMWRVPVVESDAITAGYFLVGAFKLGAQLWDREGVSIRLSEHHASYFIQNLVAILAEERYVLTIYRPSAFVYGEFSTGS
jgi:HK97 family phage major capsid protein